MQFERVAIESVGFQLPPEILTSEDLEAQLAPAYERLRLPVGRLELMSGIAERRFWHPRTAISGPSIVSANAAIEASGIDRKHIGCLIHASVCRDYLEPATACRVHAGLDLPTSCWVYDVSNACLGLLSGVVQIATMIESGFIRAGIVVGTESARNLVESTIASLNADMTLTRQSIKPSFASLTIGSGSCAILVSHRDLSRTGNQLVTAVARAESEHHGLCQSDGDQAGASMQPLMQTDSEQLLHAGVQVGARTFEQLLTESGLDRADFDGTVCHQVGAAHRRLMLDTLKMPTDRDYSTFHWLGNTGSVALPTALAAGILAGRVQSGQRTALLGIGSGINSVMLNVLWSQPLAAGAVDELAQRRIRGEREAAVI
ncbi:MAG: 3-oxoacyl-ACP synthase III [Pirellulales bacterium]